MPDYRPSTYSTTYTSGGSSSRTYTSGTSHSHSTGSYTSPRGYSTTGPSYGSKPHSSSTLQPRPQSNLYPGSSTPGAYKPRTAYPGSTTGSTYSSTGTEKSYSSTSTGSTYYTHRSQGSRASGMSSGLGRLKNKYDVEVHKPGGETGDPPRPTETSGHWP